MIILEDDPVVTIAKLLKCEVYQVFYLAAQDEGLGMAGMIATHRTKEYYDQGFSVVPDYVKTFCETMKHALRKIEHTR